MLLYELEYLILECSLKTVFIAFLRSFNLVLRNEKNLTLTLSCVCLFLMIFAFGRAPVLLGVITQLIQLKMIVFCFEMAKEEVEVFPGCLPV